MHLLHLYTHLEEQLAQFSWAYIHTYIHVQRHCGAADLLHLFVAELL